MEPDPLDSIQSYKVKGDHCLTCFRQGRHQREKNVFFRALPESPKPPPPDHNTGNDVLAHITERSKDDYDNDVSDNCDHNFGTFDDFGVKNDQKVSNNMILMSKYKGCLLYTSPSPRDS